MFDGTKVDQNTPRLTKAQREAIPSAHDHPLMKELGQRRQQLQAEFKDLTNQLNGDYRFEPEKQATAIQQLIASGILPEGTTSISADIIKEGVINRRETLTREIEQNEHDIRIAEIKIIQENCAAVDGIARELSEKVICATETLREAILALNEFYWLLTHKGNTAAMRPDKMQPMPWEHCIVYGGYCPTADFYLTNKKTLWKIK